jgi:hypothetical protein
MSDPYNLLRFIEAQASVYDTALCELEKGRKQSNWMWFIFPQLAGLGHSPTAVRFALSGLDEAHDYLAHPLPCISMVHIGHRQKLQKPRGFPNLYPFRPPQAEPLQIHPIASLIDRRRYERRSCPR